MRGKARDRERHFEAPLEPRREHREEHCSHGVPAIACDVCEPWESLEAAEADAREEARDAEIYLADLDRADDCGPWYQGPGPSV